MWQLWLASDFIVDQPFPLVLCTAAAACISKATRAWQSALCVLSRMVKVTSHCSLLGLC